MTDLWWSELQRLFHGWTGNRLARHVLRAALDELASIARAQRIPPDELLRAFERGELRAARDALIERLLNHTTWFLRDAKGIEALVEQMRQRGRHEVSVWVAGCSTGQEPYTLTMALLDHGFRPRVLATDISREALGVATEGRYRGHDLAHLPERWRSRYFVPAGPGEMRVAARVRDCVTFRHHNLAAGLPPPATGWDAVVCRNVLLYFDRDHAASIIRSLKGATAFLLLSPVEQPLAWIARARPVEHDQEVVLLKGSSPAPSPTSPPSSSATSPRRMIPRAATEPPVVTRRAPTEHVHDLVGRACDRLARGALDDAIELCDAAIDADRLFAAAHLAKGLALKRAGRFVDAVPVLRCARFLTHDEAWLAPYNLARCLERAGDRDGAVEAYRHALAIVEGGGAAGLAPWDASMDALGPTVAEACKARLTAIRPHDSSPPHRVR